MNYVHYLSRLKIFSCTAIHYLNDHGCANLYDFSLFLIIVVLDAYNAFKFSAIKIPDSAPAATLSHLHNAHNIVRDCS